MSNVKVSELMEVSEFIYLLGSGLFLRNQVHMVCVYFLRKLDIGSKAIHKKELMELVH